MFALKYSLLAWSNEFRISASLWKDLTTFIPTMLSCRFDVNPPILTLTLRLTLLEKTPTMLSRPIAKNETATVTSSSFQLSIDRIIIVPNIAVRSLTELEAPRHAKNCVKTSTSLVTLDITLPVSPSEKYRKEMSCMWVVKSVLNSAVMLFPISETRNCCLRDRR